MDEIKKYKGIGRYILETDHGYYSDYGWGLASANDDKELAIKQYEHWSKTSGNYRLIDTETSEILMTTE